MTQLLGRFAALSMVGTVLLSLLPSGGMKRTAAFAVGLLTLVCWAEGVAALLNIDLEVHPPASVLTSTAVSVEEAATAAANALAANWEGTP